jgi:hypothetical protein
MYLVCTSTGFLYWYIPSMRIMKFICESMYQYVLAGDKPVFCGKMKSLCDQMLQDTFHRYMRAYLSVLFKKIRCWATVGQWVYILGLYWVCTQYILGLYL